MSVVSEPARPLPLGLKLAFASVNAAFTSLISSTSFFLLIFLTDVALVPPALASSALLVGKLWDTINDPLFGVAVDRSRSWRRWLFLGALPLGLFTALLWVVPSGLTATQKLVWIAVTYTLFDTALTATQLPTNALAAEIEPDYHGRTRLFAFGAIGAVLGYIAGGAFMRMVVGSQSSAHVGYALAGALLGVIAASGVGFFASRVSDRKMQGGNRNDGAFAIATVVAVLRNRPFLILLAAVGLTRLGFTVVQTTLAYFSRYHLGDAKADMKIIPVLMIAVALFIPFWRSRSEQWGKGRAYGAGLAVFAVALAGTWMIQPGQVKETMVVVLIIGVAVSAHWVLPWAMLPDVVDWDEARSGERRAGIHFGVYGLVDKIFRTLGFVSVGWILDAAGYVPNAVQGEGAALAIRLLFGPVPALLVLLGVPLLFLYPIDPSAHAELRAKIDARREPAG